MPKASGHPASWGRCPVSSLMGQQHALCRAGCTPGPTTVLTLLGHTPWGFHVATAIGCPRRSEVAMMKGQCLRAFKAVPIPPGRGW